MSNGENDDQGKLGMYDWVEIDHVQINGRPKGQPRSRSRRGQIGVYNPGTADDWRADVQRAFRPRCRFPPLDEPLRVEVIVYFPRPKNFNKRTRMAYGGKAKDIPSGSVIFSSKPDPDNVLKPILDAMTDVGYMRDDALVADAVILRRYAEKNGIPGAVLKVFAWRKVDELVEAGILDPPEVGRAGGAPLLSGANRK